MARRRVTAKELRELANDMRDNNSLLRLTSRIYKEYDKMSNTEQRKVTRFADKAGKLVRLPRAEIFKQKKDTPRRRETAQQRELFEIETSKLGTFVKIDGAIIPLQQKESHMKKKAANAEATKKGSTKTAAGGKKATAPKTRKGALTGKIKILAKKNPKREGSILWKRWNVMKAGMTVEQANEKGIDSGTLRGWVQQGHITVG